MARSRPEHVFHHSCYGCNQGNCRGSLGGRLKRRNEGAARDDDHRGTTLIGQSLGHRKRTTQHVARGFKRVRWQVAAQPAGYHSTIDERHNAAKQRNAEGTSQFGAHFRDPGRGPCALGRGGAVR